MKSKLVKILVGLLCGVMLYGCGSTSELTTQPKVGEVGDEAIEFDGISGEAAGN